jgi:hypothetical protein
VISPRTVKLVPHVFRSAVTNHHSVEAEHIWPLTIAEPDKFTSVSREINMRLGAFSPVPVTLITVSVYAAIFVSLLYTHHVVPQAPIADPRYPAVNISRAWRDLSELSNGFHPYNTRRNQKVHSWILARIEEILKGNNVSWVSGDDRQTDASASVVLFDDQTSNVTMSIAPNSVYFEGENIMVYIRGIDDDDEDWWKSSQPYRGKGGVLVNAHCKSTGPQIDVTGA